MNPQGVLSEIEKKRAEFEKQCLESRIPQGYKYIEFNSSEEMWQYLKDHPGEKPFACEHLSVIPESLYCRINGDAPAERQFPKGELRCSKGGYPLCTVGKQPIQLGEDGNLHLECKNKEYDLVFRITQVNTKKQGE